MAYNSPIIPSANVYNQGTYPYSAQAAPAGMYYQPPYQSPMQITVVNGDNGARAFQMPPNSSIILLDESRRKVFIKETDGASYPKLSKYKLVPDDDDSLPEDKGVVEKQLKDVEDRLKVVEKWVLNSKKAMLDEEKKKETK